MVASFRRRALVREIFVFIFYCNSVLLLSNQTQPPFRLFEVAMKRLFIPFFCTFLAAAIPGPAPDRILLAADWAITKDRNVQLERDPRFLFSTIFPKEILQRNLSRNLKAADQEMVPGSNGTSKILARIVVAMAWGGLQFTKTENDTKNLLPWGWPLATALAHGQRVVFEVKGMESADDFYSMLLYGQAELPIGDDEYKRYAASHGLSFPVKGGVMEMQEMKLNVLDAVLAGFQGKHHGINLALGGLGNQRLDGNFIGPNGFAVDSKSFKLDTSSQHGHLYIHTDAKKGKAGMPGVTGLLVGIEPSAFNTTSMYGGDHTLASGSKDSTGEVSICGGQKMQKLFGAEGPVQYGGMWVILPNQAAFDDLHKTIVAVDAMSEADRQKLLWNLLNNNAAEAKKSLNDALK
jgi:hypothetical protein